MLRVRCPICGKEADLRRTGDWPRFPFCGERCRTIDLGRWLDERYGVPSHLADAEEAELPGDASKEVP